MNTVMRRACPLVLVLLLAGRGSVAHGQCKEGRIHLADAIELRLLGKPLVDPNRPGEAPAKSFEKVTEEQAHTEATASTPLVVASATQVEAPANASGGSEVTLPGFASLLSMAQEQGLVNSKEGVTTISLTPFSFLALIRPAYVYDQDLYTKGSKLRPWGGTLAFGGKGDRFDRDGDGKLDDPLEAKDFNDIVTWEVKYQIGSRDHRDPENFKIYENEIDVAEIPVRLNASLGFAADAADQVLRKMRSESENGCFLTTDIAAALDSAEVAGKLSELKRVDEEYKAVAKRAFTKVDTKPILTLVFGGTEKAEGFGPDKRMAAVRGAFTWLGGTNSAEASWSRVENLLSGKDPTTLKLGWQYSRNFLKDSALSKDGVNLAVAGSLEKYYDVPTVTHDTVSKVNAKISVPVTEGVSIPVSVTWANHKDLLTGEAQVQGHIGFTVDYSVIREQLMGKKK